MPSFNELPNSHLHSTPLSPRALPRSNTFEEIRKTEKENKERLDRAKRSLEDKLSALERREVELLHDSTKSRSEISTLRRQLHQLKLDNANLQAKYAALDQDRMSYRARALSLQEDLVDERDKKYEEHHKKVKELEDLIRNMQEVIDDIQSQNNLLKKRERIATDEIDALRVENQELKRKDSTKERRLEELRNENKDLRGKLGDPTNNRTIEKLQHDLSAEKHRSQNLVNHFKELEKYVKTQEENLRNEQEHNAYLVGEVEEFKQCLENEQKRSRSLVSEIDGIRQILGSERDQKGRIVDELNGARECLSAEKLRNQNLVEAFNSFRKEVADEQQHLTDDNGRLEIENKKLAGELDNVRSSLLSEKNRTQDLANELNDVKRALATEQALTQKLIKDTDSLERSLATEKSKARKQSEETAQIDNANRNLTDELTRLKSQLKSTEASRDQTSECLADAERRLQSLHSQQMQMLEMTRRTQQTPPSSEPGSITQTVTLQPGSHMQHGLLSPNTPTTQAYDMYGNSSNSLFGRAAPLSPPQSPSYNTTGKLREEKEARLLQEKQLEKLRNDHHITKEELARVESERKKLLERNRILESDKAVCEQRLQESQTALKDLTVRCRIYEEDSRKQQNLIDSLKKDLEELDESSNAGDAVMRQLEKTRTELRNANSDLEVLREDMEAVISERDEWAAAVRQLKEVDAENRKRLAELTEQNHELSQQTSDLGSSVDTFTAAENAATLMRIEKASLELKSLHVAFENLQIDNTNLAASLKEAKAAKEEIFLKYEALEASYQGSGKLESASMLEKLAKVGFELQKLRQRLEDLEVQNCQLASQLKEESDGKHTYQQKLQSLEASYQSLVNSSKQAEDELEDKYRRCEDYIHSLEMEREELKEKLMNAEKAHSELGRICSTFEDEAATATDKFNQADKDKVYWEDQYIALKEAHDELEEIHQAQKLKLGSDGKQLGELAVDYHNLRDELDFTKRKWDELKIQHADTEAALADSEQRLLSTITELNTQSAMSRQEANRLSNEATQLRANIERLKKEGMELRSTINRLETAVDQRDSAIQIRDSTIARYVTLMTEKDREIHKEKIEVSRLNHEIENWDRRHQHARSEKLKVQAEYQLLKSKLDRQEGMITQVEKEKQKLERKLERHTEQVAEKDAALREARKMRDKTKEYLEAYKEQRDACAKLMRKLNDKVNYKKKDPVPYLFWILNAKDAVDGKEARAWNCVVKKANGFKFRSYRVYA